MQTWKLVSLWMLAAATLGGCAGVKTFTNEARPGDTVALATGWNQPVNRNNLTVRFTDANAAVVTYNPGNPGIRTVTQLYPDPVSKLVVEYATGQTTGSSGTDGTVMGASIDGSVTNHDTDWNQTVVYLDLPTSLAAGTANIVLTGPNGALTATPMQVNVLPGTGAPDIFAGQGSGNASASLPLLERGSYYTVTFAGPTIPDSIQVNLTRTAGAAKPWVVNTRGDLKNVAWRDDGSTNLRVMLTSSHGVPLTDMKHFKFYVASGIPMSGLAVANVVAYDASGYPVSGVTANVSYVP
jgi:hypothetical protein